MKEKLVFSTSCWLDWLVFLFSVPQTKRTYYEIIVNYVIIFSPAAINSMNPDFVYYMRLKTK